MNQNPVDPEKHLSDAELFALAVPATGEPEAIPAHLSRCRDCSRALQEWKSAVVALAEAETGELARRTDAEWHVAEDATLAALRRAGRPRRGAHPWRWAVAIAASLLIVALVLPARRRAVSTASAVPTAAPQPAPSELTGADAADDELLRSASFLAAGGDVEGEGSGEDRL